MSLNFDYSVAINAFNREKEIGETLTAVLSQSITPREIVVVDNASTDGTREVVESFGKSVRYFRNEKNVGPGQSRHAAVSHCKAPWIATCDSDDLWEPNHIDSIAQTIVTFPDTIFAFANTTRFGPGETGDYNHFATIPEDWWQKSIEERQGDRWKFSADAYTSLLYYNPVYPSCAVFRADAYHEIGGAYAPFSFVPSEDSDLTRRLALAGTMTCCATLTVKIRKHGDNFSKSLSSNLLGRFRVLERHVRELPLSPIVKEKAAKARDNALDRAFRHACWEENLELANECRDHMRSRSITAKDRIRYLKLIVKQRLSRIFFTHLRE